MSKSLRLGRCGALLGLTASSGVGWGGVGKKEQVRGMTFLKLNPIVLTRIKGESMLMAKSISAPHSPPL